MLGILMAGGSGSRLDPLTRAVNKHLLPVYDKPLIYYSLSTLLLCGVRRVLLITNADDLEAFESLLGTGERYGIRIDYRVQDAPRGIADGLLIAHEEVSGEASVLMLGDNLFHGTRLGGSLASIDSSERGVVFAYEVADPRPYGVVTTDAQGRALSIQEKPRHPTSRLAVPGLYFLPPDAVALAESLKPSLRGELEITDILGKLIQESRLDVIQLPRGTAWLDTGTPEALHDASNYVRVLQERQGLKIGSPEEVAWRQGWISDSDLLASARLHPSSAYGTYLRNLGSESESLKSEGS